jgi:hypothetical protein
MRGGAVLAVQSLYMLIFRIVHIGSGVLWVGMSFFFTVFLGPAAEQLGPAAFPVMKRLVEVQKVPRAIESIGGFTVLGGLFLYWHDWHAYGGLGNFVGSAFGLSLTVGAVAAIAAFLVGKFGIGDTVEKLVAVGNKVVAGGGPPPPELMAETQRLGARIKMFSQIDLALLLIAVLGMATARYW